MRYRLNVTYSLPILTRNATLRSMATSSAILQTSGPFKLPHHESPCTSESCIVHYLETSKTPPNRDMSVVSYIPTDTRCICHNPDLAYAYSFVIRYPVNLQRCENIRKTTSAAQYLAGDGTRNNIFTDPRKNLGTWLEQCSPGNVGSPFSIHPGIQLTL